MIQFYNISLELRDSPAGSAWSMSSESTKFNLVRISVHVVLFASNVDDYVFTCYINGLTENLNLLFQSFREFYASMPTYVSASG